MKVWSRFAARCSAKNTLYMLPPSSHWLYSTLAQGEVAEAENLANRSLALTVAALGERHPDVAGRHRTLGHILHTGNRLAAAVESTSRRLNRSQRARGRAPASRRDPAGVG